MQGINGNTVKLAIDTEVYSMEHERKPAKRPDG
jgi:hypothetical protein